MAEFAAVNRVVVGTLPFGNAYSERERYANKSYSRSQFSPVPQLVKHTHSAVNRLNQCFADLHGLILPLPAGCRPVPPKDGNQVRLLGKGYSSIAQSQNTQLLTAGFLHQIQVEEFT